MDVNLPGMAIINFGIGGGVIEMSSQDGTIYN
jgi:hypothetical protein